MRSEASFFFISKWLHSAPRSLVGSSRDLEEKILTEESQLKKYYSLFFGQAESNCLFDHKEVFDYNLTLILKSMFSTHSYGFFKSPMVVQQSIKR